MANYVRVAYYLAGLLRHTHWSQEKLTRHRDRRVREVIRYAYDNVPFYHDKFSELGLHPDNFRKVEDLNKLPVINRDELQRNSEQLISREYDISKLRVVSTSGSTGRPFFTYLTGEEDEFRKAKLLRANIVCGQRPRDRWVVITAPQHEAHVGGVARFFGVFAPVPVSVFDGPAEQLAKVERLGPDVLDGYSSSLLLLAEEAETRGDKGIKPRMIVGGAELIDETSRRFVEDVFDAPFFDEYASVEFERLAWQCEHRDGYHIDADTVVMQFVDKDGEEVAPGETGEVVCTSLFNRAMPLLRYALGDVGVPSGEKECGCGRVFPLMRVLEGRKESVIVLPDGRVLSPLAIGDCMCAFKYFTNIYQYRFVQKRVDLFRILVKPKHVRVDERVVGEELVKHIRRTLRLSENAAGVEVEFVDEIPSDKSGKIRKVISELNQRSD